MIIDYLFCGNWVLSDSLVPEPEVLALLIPVLAVLKQLHKYSFVKTCYVCVYLFYMYLFLMKWLLSARLRDSFTSLH